MRRPSLSGYFLYAAILCALAVPQASQAQVLYGSIVGNVKDASDAVVAGAKVAITHVETKQSREETTNAMGGYSFPTLPPGTYELKVNKDGFSPFTQTGLSITVNNVSRLDVTLRVGGVTESVTVTGLAAALQTDRAEVRTEMASQQVQALPTSLGRNYQQLLVMVPGFSQPQNANSVPSNPSRALGFNVNGMSYSINSTRIDGAQSINVWLPHEAAYVPTLESVETVTTATNSFDAETGLAGGAAIYVQTKSGTNDVHGAIFESHSNQHLKAKPFFIPPGAVKPKLVYNEFGGAVGGPIRKEKLFYFVSYERNNDRESANQYVNVPTAAIKSGNMTGSNNPIYDPATGDSTGSGRTPLPGQIVPASRISKITRTLSDKTPLPNVPGDPLTQNYFATASYIFDRNRLDAKVNWNAGKLTMFGRLGFLRYNMDNPPVFGEMGGTQTSDVAGNPGHGWGDTYTIVAAGNYMLTNRFIVDAYFGWTTLGTNVDTPGVEDQQGLKLGIPGTNGPARYQGGWPKFSVSNYSDLGTPGAYLPYYRSDPSKNYVTNFNWIKGTHDIRFGVDVSYQAMNHIQAEGGSGIGAGMGGFTFTGGPTTLRGGPTSNQYNSYAAFLLGLPASVGKNVITSKDDKVTTRAWQYSSYVRDRWNVTPKLTLSVGVRWEYYPLPTRADTGLGFYDFSNNTVRVCGYGSVPAGCGVDLGKFRLLPRIGLAYRASPTFVIRAGYGITNDPWSLARGFRTNFPAMLSLDYSGENSYQPFGRIENGIPAPVLPDMANGIVAIPKTYAANSLPQKFKRGYIQSWNLTLQKELRHGFTA
ncbi:MAG: TonB-dependent receptor, partial [Bryobacterales bacterium]|nr:TonB-dependent receptor [Bryobacterales bacterium]